MSDRIRRVLAERILSGAIVPGTRLVELRIAAEFATSQAPVREALRELEMMRMVECRPYRGTYVREVCGRETDEAYRVRGVLEATAAIPAAARLSAEPGPMRQALEGIHAAARAGDREAYSRHNLDFHRSIVKAAGNSVLLRAWDSLGFEARIRLTVSREDHDLLKVAHSHDAIADALEAGDGPLAARLLREHAESFIRPAGSAGSPGNNGALPSTPGV
ncbi:GntR family transcriptional regulator [Tundrisphaera sp. TA3]|uniref:GntR family transcriptional regulator n=1 Tax=Tundrisphaera sp. TA3 TaxID=3435775 RepID=UPI003EB73967